MIDVEAQLLFTCQVYNHSWEAWDWRLHARVLILHLEDKLSTVKCFQWKIPFSPAAQANSFL